MSVKLAELTSYLDTYLNHQDVVDEPSALNGLQVDGPDTVERIAVAVDACQVTIDAAIAQGAQLLLVHHGLFWRGVEPVTGRHGRRLRALLTNGVALYSSHLPLDLHREVGNNAVLARALGIPGTESFGDYHGQAIGVVGHLELDLAELARRTESILGTPPHVLSCGPARTRRVGVITGGGGSMIRDAHAADIDTYITGEGAHHTYFDAEELGMNVLYAGHYATETVGVKALAAHLKTTFDVPWDFIDHPTGL